MKILKSLIVGICLLVPSILCAQDFGVINVKGQATFNKMVVISSAARFADGEQNQAYKVMASSWNIIPTHTTNSTTFIYWSPAWCYITTSGNTRIFVTFNGSAYCDTTNAQGCLDISISTSAVENRIGNTLGIMSNQFSASTAGYWQNFSFSVMSNILPAGRYQIALAARVTTGNFVVGLDSAYTTITAQEIR